MKKIVIFLMFATFVFSLRNVDAASNKIYFEGIITSESLTDFSDLEVNVYASNTTVEYEDFLVSYENIQRTLRVEKDGTFYFFGDDIEYIIKINENTLPDYYFCNNTYAYVNCNNTTCHFELEYNINCQSLDDQIDLSSSISFVEGEISFEKIYEQNYVTNSTPLPEEIESKEYKETYNNRFVICHDGIGATIIQNVLNNLIDIENYFYNVNGFIRPYTIGNLFYVIIDDIPNSGESIYYALTDGTYIKLDSAIFNENNSSSYYVATIVHEYFHAIQDRYYYGNIPTKYGLLQEATATFAGFKYVNDLANVSSYNINSFLHYYRTQFYNSFFGTSYDYIQDSYVKYSIKDRNGQDSNIYAFYYFFVYFFEICQDEGVNGWNAIKMLLENVDESNDQPFEAAMEDTYYSIFEESKTFLEIYEEFLIFAMDFSSNININENYISLFVNPFTENENVIKDTNQTKYCMKGDTFLQKRIDACDSTHGLLKVLVDMGDGFNDYSNVKLYIKSVRQNDTFSVTQVQLNTSGAITNISSLLGVESLKYIDILLIYYGNSTINLQIEANIEFRPYDNTKYRLAIDNGSALKYMTVELDEFGCITLDKNIYLNDKLNNNSQYFWIRKYNGSSYYIECDATSYYPEEYDDFILYINNQNVQIKCFDMWPSNIFFGFTKVSNSIYKIYLIGYSNQVLMGTSFDNGSNFGTNVLSAGNIVLSNEYNGTYLEKWKLLPTE